MKEVAFFLAHTAQYSNPRTQHEQENSTVTLVGAQNCNARSSTQHTNCKATASSTLVHLLDRAEKRLRMRHLRPSRWGRRRENLDSSNKFLM